MEKEIESLVRRYKGKRLTFGAKNYFDRSTRLKRELLSYADWDKSEILENEISLNIQTIAELKEKIRNTQNAFSEKQIPIIVLSLKNRAEYISNQADIYPAFITLIAFSFAFFGTYIPTPFRILLGVFLLVVVLYFLENRFQTRRELSH